MGLTHELHLKLYFLSTGEAIGIPSVAVKCVDIRRNTSGEGGLLSSAEIVLTLLYITAYYRIINAVILVNSALVCIKLKCPLYTLLAR